MTRLFLAFLSWFGVFFRFRHDLGLELAALRQQMGVLKRQNPRPKLGWWDRLFWLTLRRLWFKMVERPADRKAGDGRALASRRLSVVLALPFSPPPRSAENHLRTSETHPVHGSGESDLGAPRIHGELLKLGFEISECTVSR
jgi:putative transposase